ncbi:glycoside hydrolase family 16 protein [Cryomyces antarcticus]|nr:hypothetical protein LTR60_004711 [Cryomyces antarcticus]
MSGRRADKSHLMAQSDLYGAEPPSYNQSTGSRWDPRNWTRGIIVGVIVGAVVILVVIVVGAVLGTRANEYPSYSKLTYSLQDTYSGTSFFDNFDYFTGYDPSSGFVHYVDAQVATSAQYNLTYASSSSAVLRVDTTDTNANTGRYSVRVSSKKQYNSGLFVFDILNTPYGCSTWPALWLTDPANWPAHGEIDVVEAVNGATTGNQMTLHTSDGCNMDRKRKETGTVLTKNCWNGTDSNAGCGVQGPQDTYGAALNSNGGGIYAMEWRSDGIRVWFFPRTSIPTDLVSSNDASPDPSSWGTALADFPSTDCDISSHFKNQSIIANIDLCGTWAGQTSVYNTQDGCPGTCTEFVTSNATAFETAYWEWASWRVYSAS